MVGGVGQAVGRGSDEKARERIGGELALGWFGTGRRWGGAPMGRPRRGR